MRTGENVVFETRPRFLMYARSALIKFIIILLIIFFFSTIISITATIQNYIITYVQIPLVLAISVILMLLILILLLWIIWDLYSWRNTLYQITTTRVIVNKGILRKNRSSIHFDKIQDIRVTQSITGRIIGSGDIRIFSGHDFTTMFLYDIPNPNEVENLLNRAIEGDFQFQKPKTKENKKDRSVINDYEKKFKM